MHGTSGLERSSSIDKRRKVQKEHCYEFENLQWKLTQLCSQSCKLLAALPQEMQIQSPFSTTALTEKGCRLEYKLLFPTSQIFVRPSKCFLHSLPIVKEVNEKSNLKYVGLLLARHHSLKHTISFLLATVQRD